MEMIPITLRQGFSGLSSSFGNSKNTPELIHSGQQRQFDRFHDQRLARLESACTESEIRVHLVPVLDEFLGDRVEADADGGDGVAEDHADDGD